MILVREVSISKQSKMWRDIIRVHGVLPCSRNIGHGVDQLRTGACCPRPSAWIVCSRFSWRVQNVSSYQPPTGWGRGRGVVQFWHLSVLVRSICILSMVFATSHVLMRRVSQGSRFGLFTEENIYRRKHSSTHYEQAILASPFRARQTACPCCKSAMTGALVASSCGHRAWACLKLPPKPQCSASSRESVTETSLMFAARTERHVREPF